MKKLFYLLAAVAMLMACGEKKVGYTITGVCDLKGATDGDTVFLVKKEGKMEVRVDTTVINGGAFTFEGMQDSTETAWVSVYDKDGRYRNFEFFLENGNINFNINEEYREVTGTPCNDAYLAYKKGNKEINKRYNKAYEACRDTTLTEAEREIKRDTLSAILRSQLDFICNQVEKNITTPIGVKIIYDNYHYLLTSYASYAERIDSLLQFVPFSNKNVEDLKKIFGRKVNTSAGKKALSFTLCSPDGDSIRLSDIIDRNKAVIIDFWASWCGPCRADMPEMKELYKDYHSKGLEIVGVSLDGSLDSWKKAIKEEDLPWIHMSDLKGWLSQAGQMYAVQSIPATVLIDDEGYIIARDLGNDSLRKKLDEILK